MTFPPVDWTKHREDLRQAFLDACTASNIHPVVKAASLGYELSELLDHLDPGNTPPAWTMLPFRHMPDDLGAHMQLVVDEMSDANMTARRKAMNFVLDTDRELMFKYSVLGFHDTPEYRILGPSYRTLFRNADIGLIRRIIAEWDAKLESDPSLSPRYRECVEHMKGAYL